MVFPRRGQVLVAVHNFGVKAGQLTVDVALKELSGEMRQPQAMATPSICFLVEPSIEVPKLAEEASGIRGIAPS